MPRAHSLLLVVPASPHRRYPAGYGARRDRTAEPCRAPRRSTPSTRTSSSRPSSTLVRVPSITGSAPRRARPSTSSPAGTPRPGSRSTCGPRTSRPCAPTPDFPGTEAPREEAWGLVGTTPGEGPPAARAQGSRRRRPGRRPVGPGARPVRRGGRRTGGCTGRGACDMKAGVAANLAVARAAAPLRRPHRGAARAPLRRRRGGRRARRLRHAAARPHRRLRRHHRADRRPAAHRERRCADLPARGPGTSHPRQHPARGRQSAVESFVVVHAAIRELESARNARRPDPLFDGNRCRTPITIGTVQAGDWASSVPDLLVAEGRLGVALGESTRRGRRRVRAGRRARSRPPTRGSATTRHG